MTKLCDGKVSVIIPVYMVQKYIRKCVDSVLAQTYENLQIILVDDGSADDCPRICDKYAERDSRIKVIHKKNGGLSDARNVGMDAAEGEFLYFLDSDDFLEKDAVELLVLAAENTDSEMVFFDGKVFFEDKDSGGNPAYYSRKYLYGTDSGVNVIEKLVENKEFRTAVQFLFFRTKALRQRKLRFYQGILHEDGLFTVEAFLAMERVTYVPYQLYNRRMRAGSIMTMLLTSRNFHGYFVAATELIAIFDKCGKCGTKSREAAFLKKFLPQKCIGILEVYCRMNVWHQRKSKELLRQLKEAIVLHDYFEDEKLRRFLAHEKTMNMVIKGKLFIKRCRCRLSPVIRENVRYLRKMLGHRWREDIEALRDSCNADARIIIMCTPVHGNLGDHCIAEAQYQLLRDYFSERRIMELCFPSCIENIVRAKKYIRQEDVLVVCGGGWLGTIWYNDEIAVRRIVSQFKKNKIIVMPQTIYYSQDAWGRKELGKAQKIYKRHKKLYLSLRDKKSYEFCIKNKLVPDNRCFYLPDLALTYPVSGGDSPVNVNRVILCFRKDKEAFLEDSFRREVDLSLRRMGMEVRYFSTVLRQNINKYERRQKIDEAMAVLRTAGCVVTDRLHCMLFCAVLKVPCIAYDNLSGKVSGVWNWIKEKDYITVMNETDADALPTEMKKVMDARRVFDRGEYVGRFKDLLQTIGRNS